MHVVYEFPWHYLGKIVNNDNFNRRGGPCTLYYGFIVLRCDRPRCETQRGLFCFSLTESGFVSGNETKLTEKRWGNCTS